MMTLRQIKQHKVNRGAYWAAIRGLMAHGRTRKQLQAAMKAPAPF